MIEGKIPGVLYGVDKDRNVVKVLIYTELKEIEREVRIRGAALENTIYDLVVEGNVHKVIPRQIHFNPC
jgi:ribosomal protein L25 (general stress protein Ctc)